MNKISKKKTKTKKIDKNRKGMIENLIEINKHRTKKTDTDVNIEQLERNKIEIYTNKLKTNKISNKSK